MTDYRKALEILEKIRDLIADTDGSPKRDEIAALYGEVADVYHQIAGKQRIEVPVVGSGRAGGQMATYPNLFEAGFFSGRSFHTHAGKMELLRVIGNVKAKAGTQIPQRSNGARVFIVHGLNHGPLQAVARLIEKLHLPVTILSEEANQGRTLIEKFEGHSDVGFAVVLLTADDRGGPASAPYESQRPRARQNAIFELGFFIGKIGRSRVCALYEAGVEVHSDYAGVVYIPLDDRQRWHLDLARELKAAGLPVDLNVL